MGVSEEKKESEADRIFEEIIIASIFPNVMKDMNLQISNFNTFPVGKSQGDKT